MADENQKTITIDGTEYQIEDLSQEARNAAVNINATDAELRRLQAQVGIAQAARQQFAQQLRAALPEAATVE